MKVRDEERNMDWLEVKHKGDIDYLLQQYGGFYDACLVRTEYNSGAHVDENETLFYGGPADREIHMIFQRQWEPKTIDLWFTGVKRVNIAGWQQDYQCDIYGCYLDFRGDLQMGQNLIVWSDYKEFDPQEQKGKGILEEPMQSFVIAKGLRWRFLRE
jgi:hypothetical protein